MVNIRGKIGNIINSIDTVMYYSTQYRFTKVTKTLLVANSYLKHVFVIKCLSSYCTDMSYLSYIAITSQFITATYMPSNILQYQKQFKDVSIIGRCVFNYKQ